MLEWCIRETTHVQQGTPWKMPRPSISVLNAAISDISDTSHSSQANPAGGASGGRRRSNWAVASVMIKSLGWVSDVMVAIVIEAT